MVLTGRIVIVTQESAVPRARRVAIAASTVPVLITLSGCSVVSMFAPHVESAIFDTAKGFEAAGTARFGSPGFVPGDATLIRVNYDTSTGEAILTYTSPTHVLAGTCETETAMPKPKIQDSWWPISGLPEKASDCGGGWSAFVLGDQTYAAKAASGK
ncbi:hypothetical protein O159_05740 [Leifsonia xyli subsp. cynodontis DSM 46306]|uniref:Uncharacterized protein n=1 Tax=Leifsonia xyli subsp. cynodontis DSM 46306 TaxID=1389489 RepID=U3P368_LEIXC|nr:hypothetical protein O159_05740 [Leifsonia xyli subsp. cynodontis DSM 46306]